MRSSILVLMLLALSPGLALAGNPMTRELARKHYELGETLYQTSSYPEALVEFEKAYKLEPLPELLFNIARCHEVLANLDLAIQKYEEYLQNKPDADNRALVEARLKNLRKRQTTAPMPAPVKPTSTSVGAGPAPARSAPKPEQPPPRERRDSWKRIAGWVGVGLGVAGLGAGVALGAMAGSKDAEFDEAFGKNKPYGELLEIDDAGRQYNTAAIASMVTGGALAAAGVGLLLWYYLGGERAGEGTASVTPLLSPEHLGLGATVRF